MQHGEQKYRRGCWSLAAASCLCYGLSGPVAEAGEPRSSRRRSYRGLQHKTRPATLAWDRVRLSARPIRLASGTEPEQAQPAAEDASHDERSTSIDLSTALRLAGVENLELVIARQRVERSVAIQQLAAAQILPNVNLGTNYDSHTGNLQQASGNILNVQRSALVCRGGANAVAAGTVSIPGVQWNLNVSESIYNYFATGSAANSRGFANRAAENAVLLRVARGLYRTARGQRPTESGDHHPQRCPRSGAAYGQLCPNRRGTPRRCQACRDRAAPAGKRTWLRARAPDRAGIATS